MSNKGGCTATHFQLNISTSSRKPLYFQFFKRERRSYNLLMLEENCEVESFLLIIFFLL